MTQQVAGMSAWDVTGTSGDGCSSPGASRGLRRVTLGQQNETWTPGVCVWWGGAAADPESGPGSVGPPVTTVKETLSVTCWRGGLGTDPG